MHIRNMNYKKTIISEQIEQVRRALENIDSGYFRLTTTYEPDGIVRERVFCYEFYHQLRALMSADRELSLNGEIDKRGHIDFDSQDRKNPDFVFHIPGTHRGNTLVIEVKGKINSADIEKDFTTISTFIEKYEYSAGIFILYNHSQKELIEATRDVLKKVKERQSSSSIYILSIQRSGNCCEKSLVSEIKL